MVVGLHEEGAVGQHAGEQIALCVHDDAHAAAGQALHDLLVHVGGQRVGYGAGDDEGVVLAKDVQLGEERVHVLGGNAGALAVDLGLLDGLDLGVDAREARLDVDEVRVHAAVRKELLQRDPRDTGAEAQRARGVAEVTQDD